MPDRTPARAAAGVLAAAVAVGAAACGSSGRTMVAPAPGATAPPRSTSTTAGTASGPQLTSSAFAAGGALPADYLCEAESPPPLAWSTPSKNTKELVLVMFALRPNAEVQWMITGISPTVTAYTGSVPTGGQLRVNSYGKVGYTAPCPAEGQVDNYQFEILALSAPGRINESQTPTGILQSLEAQAGSGRGFLTTNNVGGQPGSSPRGSRPPGSSPGSDGGSTAGSADSTAAGDGGTSAPESTGGA